VKGYSGADCTAKVDINPTGLSSGATAAVVIVVLLLLIIISLTVYLVYYKKQVDLSMDALSKLKDFDPKSLDPRNLFSSKKDDERSFYNKNSDGVTVENPNYDEDC